MNLRLRLTPSAFLSAMVISLGFVAIALASAAPANEENYPTSEPNTINGGGGDFNPMDLIHDAQIGSDISPGEFRRQSQEDLRRSTEEFRRQQLERLRDMQQQQPAEDALPAEPPSVTAQ